jgi:EmrB/QacA subfamily drug resistance transporter
MVMPATAAPAVCLNIPRRVAGSAWSNDRFDRFIVASPTCREMLSNSRYPDPLDHHTRIPPDFRDSTVSSEPTSVHSCRAWQLRYNVSFNPRKRIIAREDLGDMQKSGQAIEAMSSVDGKVAGKPALPGRRMVTAALLVAMMVTAVEQLVVSPAMPTIIAQLKGFEIYPWVVSAFLLAATVSTPIYGKLVDLFGRKRVLLFGLTLFSVGSALSGTSQSMVQLIAMRTLQGLGAGAVGPIVLTMLGDLFTLHERARVQSLFSAVWGLSSVGGPLLGGYLTDNLGWRWVFLTCVPFAVAAILMLVYYVTEPPVKRSVAPIDWAGAVLLTLGLSALLLLVLDGSRHGWGLDGALAIASVVLLVLFAVREHHATDPILPLDLMIRPTIAASLVGSILFGAILFGLDVYVPLYVQGVRGGDATQAGRALMPLFVAWAISVALAARAVVHWGFRRGGIMGSALAAVGNLILVVGASYPGWSSLCFPVGLAVVGTGMGPTSLSFILAVQHAVSWGQRGVATGAITFLRTIGGAVGVGVLGAVVGWELAHRLAQAGAGTINIASALRPETHNLLRPDQLVLVQANLGLALRDVYCQLTLLAVGSLFCALWLPNKHATLTHSRAHERHQAEDERLAVAATEF